MAWELGSSPACTTQQLACSGFECEPFANPGDAGRKSPPVGDLPISPGIDPKVSPRMRLPQYSGTKVPAVRARRFSNRCRRCRTQRWTARNPRRAADANPFRTQRPPRGETGYWPADTSTRRLFHHLRIEGRRRADGPRRCRPQRRSLVDAPRNPRVRQGVQPENGSSSSLTPSTTLRRWRASRCPGRIRCRE